MRGIAQFYTLFWIVYFPTCIAFNELPSMGLVDEVMAFIAPKIIGGKSAKTPVEGDGVTMMADAIQLRNRTVTTFGDDILIAGEIFSSSEDDNP